MNVTIQKAIEEFDIDMEGASLADHTRTCYRGYVLRFATVAAISRKYMTGSIDALSVAKFYKAIETASGRFNAAKALRRFFRFCVRMKYMTKNQAEDALGERKQLQPKPKPKLYVTVDRFQEMLSAAEGIHPWDRAVMGTALYTLGRQSELCAIQLKHINLDERTFVLLRPKRKRWTPEVIGPDLWDEWEPWLKWYARDQGYISYRAMMEDHPEWYLLPRKVTKAGQDPVTKQFTAVRCVKILPDTRAYRLEGVMKRCLDAMGYQSPAGSLCSHPGEGLHCVRRSGARALLDYLEGEVGADRALLMVAAKLDHEDPKITLVYIGIDIERDRLNARLATSSMYGPRNGAQGANILNLSARRQV